MCLAQIREPGVPGEDGGLKPQEQGKVTTCIASLEVMRSPRWVAMRATEKGG